MKYAHSSREIKKRLIRIIKETRGRISRVIDRASYEFGVDSIKYKKGLSFQEIVEITFQYQTSPSALELELQREIEQYEILRT